MRGVPEWVGLTDDAPVPPRVRLRIFDRYGGRCALCTRALSVRDMKCLDHIVALVNGGANAEANLQLLCEPCHLKKTGADIAEKARVYAKRMAHVGFQRARSRRKLPHGKGSPTKRKITGEVVRR